MGKLRQDILSFFGIVFVCFGLVSCTEANDTSIFNLPLSEIELDRQIADGMVHVKPNAEKAVLGTNDIWAKMSERPMMSAGFTYDFYMGRHEVICKDFNDVMENATGLTIACEQDSMPAANVTFYDAVLYANALSKERGFDTSYTYAVVNPDVDISAMSFDASILQDNLKLLQSLKAFADSNGVQLIAAIPPRNPGYTFTEAFDPYGPSNDVARQIIDAVKGMGILIFDENKNGHHDYTSAMAYNPNHLSYLGAAQFSVRLDAFLKSLP